MMKNGLLWPPCLDSGLKGIKNDEPSNPFFRLSMIVYLSIDLSLNILDQGERIFLTEVKPERVRPK